MAETTDTLSELSSLRIDRSQQQRGQTGRGIAVAAALVVAGVGGVAAKPHIEAAFFKTPVDLGEIGLVSPLQASIELSSSGYVVPKVHSAVGARIPGRVQKLAVHEGEQVEAGQLLLELESSTQRAALQAAKQKAAVARAHVATARATLAEFAQQARRQTALVKRGAAPAATADDLNTHVAALEAQVKVTEAEANAADAEVDVLKVELDAMTIRAPIAGTILNEPPEVGEVLGNDLGIGTTVGTIEIADLSSLYVKTDVPEGRLHLVKVGSPCEIVLDASPERHFRGEAVEVTPRVDRAKATVGVKVKLLDAVDDVLPDMSARVSFLSKDLDPAQIYASPKLVVPSAAVTERNGGKVVFVVDGNAVHLHKVTLGEPLGEDIELKQGPEPGTRVVREPPVTLTEGSTIKERVDS